MSTTTARPRQTTMAGAMVMLGAGFVVLSMWDTVTRLRSIETRATIERILGDLGLDSSLSVEEGIRTAHGLATLAALGAVAAIALGWQALQRSRVARVGLSVLAVPLFLSGLVTSGFASALVAAATAVLWLSPSREWFAGKPIPAPGSGVPERMRVWEQSPHQTSNATPDEPSAGVSPPPADSTGWPVSASASDARPGPVTAALVFTVVTASVVLMMTLASLVLAVSQPDAVLEEVRRQNPDLDESGVSESLVLRASYVMAVLVLIWCAVAIGLAVLTARRRAGAARALLVCAAVCAVVSVLATFGSPVALVPALAAVATVRCLRHPAARAWFDNSPGPLV